MLVQLIGNCQLNNKFFHINFQEQHGTVRLFDCRVLKETFVPKGEEVQSSLEKYM